MRSRFNILVFSAPSGVGNACWRDKAIRLRKDAKMVDNIGRPKVLFASVVCALREVKVAGRLSLHLRYLTCSLQAQIACSKRPSEPGNQSVMRTDEPVCCLPFDPFNPVNSLTVWLAFAHVMDMKRPSHLILCIWFHRWRRGTAWPQGGPEDRSQLPLTGGAQRRAP